MPFVRILLYCNKLESFTIPYLVDVLFFLVINSTSVLERFVFESSKYNKKFPISFSLLRNLKEKQSQIFPCIKVQSRLDLFFDSYPEKKYFKCVTDWSSEWFRVGLEKWFVSQEFPECLYEPWLTSRVVRVKIKQCSWYSRQVLHFFEILFSHKTASHHVYR